MGPPLAQLVSFGRERNYKDVIRNALSFGSPLFMELAPVLRKDGRGVHLPFRVFDEPFHGVNELTRVIEVQRVCCPDRGQVFFLLGRLFFPSRLGVAWQAARARLRFLAESV